MGDKEIPKDWENKEIEFESKEPEIKEEKKEKRKFPPLITKKEERKTESQKDEEYKEKANERLEKRGSSLRVVNISLMKTLLIIGWVFALVFLIFFIIFGFNGNFKSVYVDNSTCINSCPVIPECPALSCGTQNITIKMPDSLTLNIDKLNITKYNSTCLTGCFLNSS